MERLFADLGVDPEDVITLILAWQLKASALGEFTQDEWKEGLTYLKYAGRFSPFPPLHHLSQRAVCDSMADHEHRVYRCDDIPKFQEKLPTLRALIKEQQNFREFYHFVFNYGKDTKTKGLGESLSSLALSPPPLATQSPLHRLHHRHSSYSLFLAIPPLNRP
jgi:hypothetical protein